MSSTRRSASSVLSGEVVARGTQVLAFFALAGLLTPRDFGLAAVAAVALAAVSVLTSVGLGAGTTALGRDLQRDRAALAAALLLGLGAALVLQLLAAPAAVLLGAPAAEPLVRLAGAVALLQPYADLRAALLEREGRFAWTGATQAVAAVVAAAVAVGLARQGAGAVSLVAQLLAYQAVRAVLLALPGRAPRRPALLLSPLRDLWRYVREVFLAQALVTAFLSVDNAAVGRLAGTTSLGAYSFAFQLANLPVLVLAHAAGRLLLPAYSREVRAGRPLAPLYDRTLTVTAWAGALVLLGLLVNGPALLGLLYGPERWQSAYLPLQVLCLFGFLRTSGVASGTVFNALQEPRVNRQVVQWQLAALLALIVPAVLVAGPLGAAAAVTATTLGGVAVSLVRCDRRLGRPVTAGLRTLGVAALAAGACVLAGRVLAALLAGGGWTELLVSAGLATVAWALLAARRGLLR